MEPNEILDALDRQYLGEAWLDEAAGRWPLRPSASDGCRRAQQIGLLRPERTRVQPARLLRQFERGHQRGAELAKKLSLALSVDSRVDHVQLAPKVSLELAVDWVEDDPLDRLLNRWIEAGAGERFTKIRGDALQGGMSTYSHLVIGGEADIAVHFRDYQGSPPWLIDAKAEGAYGWKKDDPGYLSQQGLYAMALGSRRAFLLRECQEKSHGKVGTNPGDLKLTELPMDECLRLAAEAIDTWVWMLEQVRDGVTELHDSLEPDGKSLPWRCNYCPLGRTAPVEHRCFPYMTLIDTDEDKELPRWKSAN